MFLLRNGAKVVKVKWVIDVEMKDETEEDERNIIPSLKELDT